MNPTKLSFESEKLVVDYISFNIPGSNNTESIAKYLFEKFNFNSTFAKGQNGTTDDWFYLPVNQHQVSFRELEYDPSFKSFWKGTTIHFSGPNAAQFYKIIQVQKFDLETVMVDQHTLSLGRINLCFSKTNGPNDTITLFDNSSFFSNISQNLTLVILFNRNSLKIYKCLP